MTIFGDLPTWLVALLCLPVAGVLLAQNLGWLLWARALIQGRSQPFGTAPRTPTRKPDERARSAGR